MDLSPTALKALDSPRSLNLEQAIELKRMIDQGEDVYGVYRTGAKAGTIGRITGLTCNISSTSIYFGYSFTLTVDGREPYSVWNDEVGILFGYHGPTVWKFTRAAKGANVVPIIDKTGEEVEVGDLVFVAEGDRLYYGKVERRSPVGTVWIRQSTSNPAKRLGGAASIKCGPIRDNQIVKIDGDTLNRLMLAKLAS